MSNIDEQTPVFRLSRSDAILRIMEIIGGTAERFDLEGMAYLATQPSYAREDCRILRAFDHNADEWMAELHDDISSLQSGREIELVGGRYCLTSAGYRRLAEIQSEIDSYLLGHPFILKQEVRRISHMVEVVRIAWGL